MSEDEHFQDRLETSQNAGPATVAEAIVKDPKPRGIAPVWHTVVLVLGILAYSIWGAIGAHSGTSNPLAPSGGATHATATGTDHVRLIRYALTGTLELAIVAWIAFGLRLRKVPFRSLFGAWPKGLNAVTLEVLVAAAFWVCSMVILLVCAISWLFVQNYVYKQQTATHRTATTQSGAGSAKPKSPQEQQSEMVKQLTELAPANGVEIAAWGLLCLVVGFSEELIFRGYLQSQGMALLRSTPVAVVAAAIVFGAGHGYQGIRGMVLISVYGTLFGVLALIRRNLLPGMIAHSWHDFATGMALALIRSSHLLERLSNAPK